MRGIDIRSPGACFKSIGLQTSFLITYLHAFVCSKKKRKQLLSADDLHGMADD
jgi:hypothetical protein